MADEITLVVEATAEIPLIVDSNGLSAYEVALVNGFVGTEAEWLASLVGSGLGYTAENVANKDTDSTFAANSDTRYPSQKAVKTALDLKMNASVNAGGEISGPISNLQILNSAVLAKVLTGLSISGASITATDNLLQAFGKLQSQINGVLGGAIYQGVYNATTNSASLVDGTGTKGHYYVVSVAGVQDFGSGSIDFNVGDWAIYNGTIWQKVDNTDAVSSVNGKLGAVSLTTADISEVTNLYFTTARVLATVITGFTSGAGTVLATDTVLQALQKIDGNVSGKQSTLVSGTNIKTVNGVSILGSGDLTIASGITIGSTSITGGATGQLLFNLGGVVSSSSGLTFASGLLTVLGTTQQVKYAYDTNNRLDLTVDIGGGTTMLAVGTSRKISMTHAPIATANYGAINLGDGVFDGASANKFVGSLNGTILAVHPSASFTGDIVNFQAYNASSWFKINVNNQLDIRASTDLQMSLGRASGAGLNFTLATGANALAKITGDYFTSEGNIYIGTYSHASDSANLTIDRNGRHGFNVAAPACLIHGISTTEQARYGYNSTNYASFTVDASANLTIGLTASSGTPKLKITCRLNLTGIPTSSAGLVTGDVWSNSGILTII